MIPFDPPTDEAQTRSQVFDEKLSPRGPRVLAFWHDGSTSVSLSNEVMVLTVGRAKHCDLRVDSAAVSRTHVKLHVGVPDEMGDRSLTVEDLGSANGSRINGVRMEKRSQATISPGDVVEIGSAVLLVQRFGDAPIPPPMGSPSSKNDEVVLSSPAMQRLYRTLDLVSASRINVLIVGETGVGKEVAAHAVHDRSPRRDARFIAMNCASMPENLLESELFGFERGAFTGAERAKEGLIEAADGGTLLLDEVGELPIGVQGKLLRIIEEGEVRRLGSTSERSVDVRFVAATNRPLEAMVEAGTFRRDLFYRLNGINLHIPPLRDHVEDVEPLARLFVARAAAAQRMAPPPIAAEALAALAAHQWPGNIRELRNVMERALVLSRGGLITESHVTIAAPTSTTTAPATGGGLRKELVQLERDRIIAALEETGGNQTRAAELLGMSRRTLVKRLGEYNLPRPRKKRS